MKIAYGDSRLTKIWKNNEISWEDFIKRIASPVTTSETVEEYRKLKKNRQDAIKDVGGFVMGHLAKGRRKKGQVLCRSAITLDMDFGTPDVIETVLDPLPFQFALYSTHKHTPQAPRLRMIIPLIKDVTEAEYEPIARYLANTIGMDLFDDSTYEATRLMYWPSVSINGKYVYKDHPGKLVDGQAILQKYANWQDASTWPKSSRQSQVVEREIKTAQDPLTKTGIIGAFCRTYSIEDAIQKFLPNIYVEGDIPGRYTYVEGESSNGLVIYDSKFAYSFHATDPCCNTLCNAFDLVRIHLFRDKDINMSDETDVAKLPSFREMSERASKDKDVQVTLLSEKLAESREDFGDIANFENDDLDWAEDLKRTKSGELVPSAVNIATILEKDKVFQPIVYNTFSNVIDVRGKLPWKRYKQQWGDSDLASCKIFFEKRYGIWSPTKFKDALLSVTTSCRQYHPVREYLNTLKWDGISRIDSIFIDYLGAADNIYVREATRKMMTAAVKRIYEPGTKFDNMVVLVGPQGIGKSTIFNKLGKDWFSDSLSLTDMADKTGAEKIQGVWIMEIGELAGIRKMDLEKVKGFITTKDDKYRQAYGVYVESHPRQCILVGTTNAYGGFLRDSTGNRRFWPIEVNGNSIRKPWDLDVLDIDMLWAEAVEYYHAGEELKLSPAAEKLCDEAQRGAMETDGRLGIIQEYLDMPLPENWNKMDLLERRAYISGDQLTPRVSGGSFIRQKVCVLEIWCECLGNSQASITRKDSMEIESMLYAAGWDRYVENRGRRKFGMYGIQIAYERINQVSKEVSKKVSNDREVSNVDTSKMA